MAWSVPRPGAGIDMEVNHKETGRQNVERILGHRKDQKLAIVNMIINSWDPQTDGNFFKFLTSWMTDRLCGLVVRVPGYRSRSPGSIPGPNNFLRNSENGIDSTQPRE
jgi:hypothetical protein